MWQSSCACQLPGWLAACCKQRCLLLLWLALVSTSCSGGAGCKLTQRQHALQPGTVELWLTTPELLCLADKLLALLRGCCSERWLLLLWLAL